MPAASPWLAQKVVLLEDGAPPSRAIAGRLERLARQKRLPDAGLLEERCHGRGEAVADGLALLVERIDERDRNAGAGEGDRRRGACWTAAGDDNRQEIGPLGSR